jgi:GWxTD domain-containing protein
MAKFIKHFAILFVFCSSFSYAQFGKEMAPGGGRTLNPVIFEAIPYWCSDTTSIDLVIFYRVSSSFFFFVRKDDAQQERYEAKAELIVEILDSNNVTVERNFRPMRVERNSIPTEDAPSSEEIQGIFTFRLQKGMYGIVVEAKDNESGSSFINRDTKVDARTSSFSDLNISPIIFINPVKIDTSSSGNPMYYPMNHGGNVIIGEPGVCMFQIVSPDTSTDPHLSWKIQSTNKDQDEIIQNIQGERCSRQSGLFSVIENTPRASFTIKKESAYSRFIFAAVPLERLEAGSYLFTATVTQGLRKSVKESKLKVLWPSQPRSLANPQLAVEALKHIATEKEIDQMTPLSSHASKIAFSAFWQKRNPDTTRAYNPVMAEYYRRVDESLKRFSTANENDGYRTDRGRIFILFGAPTITNRLLKPNSAPSEIWTYEKLRKRFTFTDSKKDGNFILVKMENY